jgi:hypothetical protein
MGMEGMKGYGRVWQGMVRYGRVRVRVRSKGSNTWVSR